jgi:tRNA-dihydrouridine synthase B
MFAFRPIACLAPMDGYTDTAFRRIVRSLNPEVVLFSEFTSINGIEHSDFVRSRLNFQKDEAPYLIQLFGNEPELFARIVESFQDSGINGVDINMGCPSKNIIKSNSGGSLMKERDLACKIVDACCKATDLPVSVKTRLGWDDKSHLNEFVSGLVDAGASMISIHGRTFKQKYKGVADWDPIYELKEKINVPVIGNGDLSGKDHALQMMKNLDGYMIGRASIGDPWVFWSDLERKQITLKDKISVMIHHFQLTLEFKEERRTLIEFRKYVAGYVRGFNGAKGCRSLLMKCTTEKEFIVEAKFIAENYELQSPVPQD